MKITTFARLPKLARNTALTCAIASMLNACATNKDIKPYYSTVPATSPGLAPVQAAAPATVATLSSQATPVASAATTPVEPAKLPAVMQPEAGKPFRVKAGASSPLKDSEGNLWAPDQGFAGGDVVERPDSKITGTTRPEIYLSEHYGMDSFSCPLANGNYIVKLHFAETFEGILDAGQRVFSFNVQGRAFNDFDIWAKTGGPFKAYVETVPVEVNNGKLLITFTTKVENPEINGIEIIPQP
jgi:hypothetical protein